MQNSMNRIPLKTGVMTDSWGFVELILWQWREPVLVSSVREQQCPSHDLDQVNAGYRAKGIFKIPFANAFGQLCYRL
jgi:hypothetical protein